MTFDAIPIWGLFLLTLAVVELALEAGFRLGQHRLRRATGKSEVSGAMVGATMGLLAFLLAFTFNGAATRHEARKSLVIKEANAIDQTWLRAGFLEAPDRDRMRSLLREYVGVRVAAAAGKVDLKTAAHQSEALHDSMWAVTEALTARHAASISDGLFIQSLNEVIDLHLERLTVAVRMRVPPSIWLTLYLLLAIGMVMIGTQVGLGGTRHFGMELALALSFSLVLFVIADLDRPQEGIIRVSQQAMVELQARMDAR